MTTPASRARHGLVVNVACARARHDLVVNVACRVGR